MTTRQSECRPRKLSIHGRSNELRRSFVDSRFVRVGESPCERTRAYFAPSAETRALNLAARRSILTTKYLAIGDGKTDRIGKIIRPRHSVSPRVLARLMAESSLLLRSLSREQAARNLQNERDLRQDEMRSLTRDSPSSNHRRGKWTRNRKVHENGFAIVPGFFVFLRWLYLQCDIYVLSCWL